MAAADASSKVAGAPAAHPLTVSIIKATGLPHLNKVSADALYCICKVVHADKHQEKPASFQTKTVHNTTVPEWNEEHSLEGWSAGDSIEFTIYNEGLLTAKIQGKATLTEDQFFPHGFAGELALAGLTGGKLFVNIGSVGQGSKVAGRLEEGLAHLVDAQEAARIGKVAQGLAESAPPWAAQYLKKAAPAIGWAGAGAEAAYPLVVSVYEKSQAVYERTPTEVLRALYGLAMCFYGGRYTVTIAAIEAFHQVSGKETMICLRELSRQFDLVRQANLKDDTLDEDNDGIPDVDEVSPKELTRRKLAMALRTIDPEKVQRGVGGLWSGYMGVLAVLKFQFAQTVALAHSIGDHLRPAAEKLMRPSALAITPPQYQQWVNPAINVACKLIAGFIAWRIKKMISTVQSGVSGGLLAARSTLDLLRVLKKFNTPDDQTMLDEAGGYSLAACGIFYQIFRGGPVPFFVKPIMLPLDILEWWLQWSVTWLGNDSKSVKND